MHHSKVALITGAARRIGAAIARILHENGYFVVIHYHHSRKEAELLTAEFNAARHTSALCFKADLTDFKQLKLLIENVILEKGQLDVLINNASCFYKTKMGSITEKAWDAFMDIHLKAPFFLSDAAFPYLAKQQGCIINISDIHGIRPMRDYPVYSISKAGLTLLTKALAREFGPHVRVNSISPGAILWPEKDNTLSADIKQKIIKRTALQRHGHPDDIAKAVLFLVRDGGFITGQDLAVEGGRLLTI